MTYPWPTLMPMGIVVISCVRPSVQPSMGLGLCIAYKALGRNGLQFGMLMYPDGLLSAFMDAYGYCCWSVCPSICPFVCLRHFQVAVHFFLRLGLGQRRAVVIIGRWLLPSLVDTGDICCHYWQHILVLTEWNRSNLGFPGICRRTHGGNCLIFCMLLYLGHFQNWLDYSYSLVIFLIMALFWLVKRVKFGVSRHLREDPMRKWPEILHADVSWSPRPD